MAVSCLPSQPWGARRQVLRLMQSASAAPPRELEPFFLDARLPTRAARAWRGRQAATWSEDIYLKFTRNTSWAARTFVIIVALLPALALAQPLPQPKPPGPGGSCPHGYSASGSFCVPRAGAPDAIPFPPNGSRPPRAAGGARS